MPLAKIQQNVPSKPSKKNNKESLLKVLNAIQSTHHEVLAKLESIASDDPVPKQTNKDVERQKQISSGHAAERKDLAKTHKRGKLQTNRAKLARLAQLIRDVNGDVANTNSIAGSAKHERDKQYGELVKDLERQITKELPPKVKASDIGLPRLLDTFTSKNKREQWRRFGRHEKKLVGECRELGKEHKRVSEIQGFMNGDEFRSLNDRTRAQLVEDGESNPTKSPAAVREELRAALAAQRKASNPSSDGTYESIPEMRRAETGRKVESQPSKSSEKNFVESAKAIQRTLDHVSTMLESIAQDEPVPENTEKAVEKQRKTLLRHAAELEDLARSQRRGELHTNPSKLKRLTEEVNRDVAKTNSIARSVKDERNEEYGELVKVLGREITNALPGKVEASGIRLSGLLKDFTNKNKSEQWRRFDHHKAQLAEKCRELGQEADAKLQRDSEIQGLMNRAEFRSLNYRTRAKLVENGKNDQNKSAATVRQELKAALDDQRKPNKSRWAKFLGLTSGGSYKITRSGAYGDAPIHWTMSNDSWNSDANGGVDVSTNSVEAIYEKLLRVDGWKQLHATLEVPGVHADDRPHVFLFAGVLGNDKKWAKLDKSDSWKAGAKEKMKSQLSSLASGIKKKITEAKRLDGAI